MAAMAKVRELTQGNRQLPASSTKFEQEMRKVMHQHVTTTHMATQGFKLYASEGDPMQIILCVQQAKATLQEEMHVLWQMAGRSY